MGPSSNIVCSFSQGSGLVYTASPTLQDPPMYDHWLPDHRSLVPPAKYKEFRTGKINTHFEYPRLFYDNGEEVPIIMPKDPRLLSSFCNLEKVKKLFAGDDMDVDAGDEIDGITYDQSTTKPCYIYPLCFTGKYGNFQSQGPMPCMAGQVHLLNMSLGAKVLLAGGLQGYESITHRVQAGGAKFQEASKAEGCAYMAGVLRKGSVQEKKWLKLKKILEVDLPHQRFAKSIKGIGSQFNSLRLEGVWHVCLDKLLPDQQNARYVLFTCWQLTTCTYFIFYQPNLWDNGKHHSLVETRSNEGPCSGLHPNIC